MKLYLVSWKMKVDRDSNYDSDQGTGFHSKWVGSQADAAKTRRIARQTHNYIPSSVETEEINVPTDKKGLLQFLNRTND